MYLQSDFDNVLAMFVHRSPKKDQCQDFIKPVWLYGIACNDGVNLVSRDYFAQNLWMSPSTVKIKTYKNNHADKEVKLTRSHWSIGLTDVPALPLAIALYNTETMLLTFF